MQNVTPGHSYKSSGVFGILTDACSLTKRSSMNTVVSLSIIELEIWVIELSKCLNPHINIPAPPGQSDEETSSENKREFFKELLLWNWWWICRIDDFFLLILWASSVFSSEFFCAHMSSNWLLAIVMCLWNMSYPELYQLA